MGGRRIDDHSSWLGSGKDGMPPAECKVAKFDSANGNGGLSQYEDSSERVKAVQNENVKKMKAHPMKPGYRN